MSRVFQRAGDWARSFPSFCLEEEALVEKNLETYLQAIQSSKDSYSSESTVKCIAVSVHTVLAGLENGMLFMLRNGQSDFLGEGSQAAILAVAILKEDSAGITVHSDGTMRTWNLEEKRQEVFKDMMEKEMLTLHESNEEAICRSAAISKDGGFIFWGNSDTLRFWSIYEAKEVASLRGHSGPLTSLAVSASGSLVASGSEDQTVKIWSVTEQKEVTTLSGHSGRINSVAISADERYAVSGSADLTVKIWLLKEAKVVTLNGHTADVSSVVISADGKYILSGSWDNTVKVWSFDEQKEVATIRVHSGRINSVAMAVDGKNILSGGEDKTIKISGSWDKTAETRSLDEQKEVATFSGHASVVSSVAISTDGKYVISGSWDNDVKVWSCEEQKEVFTLSGHSRVVNSVAITANGKLIVTGSEDNTVRVWSFDEQLEVATLNGHSGKIYSVAISACGRFILSGSKDKTVKIWSFHEYKEVFTLCGHTSYVYSVAITACGRYVISGSWDKTIKIWSFEDQKELGTLSGHTSNVSSVAVTANGKYIVSGSWDCTVKIWSFEEQRELATLSGHSGEVFSVAITADTKHIISGSGDSTVKIWSFEEQKELATLNGHTSAVSSIAIYGKLIISGSNDSSVKVWSLDEQLEVVTNSENSIEIYCVATTPCGHFFVTGSEDTTVKIWSLDSQKEVATLTGHTADVFSVTVSADGKYILSGSGDFTVKIWSFYEQKEVATLSGHSGSINSVAITASGKFIVSGSEDQTVKIWSFFDQKEVATLSGHNGEIYTVAISADERLIVTGSADGSVKVWSFNGHNEVATLSGHHGEVYSVAITANYILSGGNDRTVKIWSLDEYREIVTLSGHTSDVSSITISADGRYIFSGSWDSSVKVWSFDEQKEVATLSGYSGEIYSIAITADGEHIVAGSSDSVKVVFLYSSRLVYANPSLSASMPFPLSRVFTSNIPKWISGDNTASISANQWYIRPENINSLHISAYFNHPTQLSSALLYGVPLLKSRFGSPVAISLQRNTIDCLNSLLSYIVSRVATEHSDAWSTVAVITDDLPEILKSDSAVVYPFIKCLLTASEPQALPSMIRPKSDLPILLTQPFRLFHICDFDESSDLQRTMTVVKFFLSLVKWNTTFGSRDSLELLSALRDSTTRKVMRTPFVMTLLDMKWRQVRFIFWLFTFCYALLLINLVCIIFRYWRLDVLCGSFIFLNALFLLIEIWECIGSLGAYLQEVWNWVDTLRGVLSITWAVVALRGSNEDYVTLLVVILCFLRGFTYFRCAQVTRVFVFLTMQVIAEVYTFLIILAFSVFSFGLMASVLAADQHVAQSWTVAFSLLMGNFEDSQYNLMERLIFTAACVLNVIIMLNLLISILGDAYESAQMTIRENDYYQILEVCFEFETMCFWRRNAGVPTVIMSCVSARPDVKNKDWSGKIVQITKEVRKQLSGMEGTLMSELAKVEEKIGGVKGTMERKMMGMEAKIEAKMTAMEAKMEEKMTGVEEKLETIVGLLRSSS